MNALMSREVLGRAAISLLHLEERDRRRAMPAFLEWIERVAAATSADEGRRQSSLAIHPEARDDRLEG